MSSTMHKDERGLVSFMITLIMMLVISLVVIGFTQVANRNQREALDQQLSSQAFYAAESGVNEAISNIRTALASGNTIQTQTTCAGHDYPAAQLSTDPVVEYTCVLVNPLAPDITTSATSQSSTVAPLDLANSDGSSATPASLKFTWSVASGGSTDPADCTGTAGQFKPNTASYACGYALLRVDLLQYDPASNSPAQLLGDTASFYMQPVNGGSGSYSLTDFSTQKAAVVPAACNSGTGTCSATLNVSGGAAAQYYYARVSTLYHDTDKLVIDGVSSSGTDLWFKDSQAVVDVTGKAQDVLRRVQVRVPLQNFSNQNLPEGSIQSSAAVCKQFTAYSGFFSDKCP